MQAQCVYYATNQTLLCSINNTTYNIYPFFCCFGCLYIFEVQALSKLTGFQNQGKPKMNPQRGFRSAIRPSAELLEFDLSRA